MATISEETCNSRRESCRISIYRSIGQRVTWTVLMALLSLLGAGVGYAVVLASTRASAVDLARVEDAASVAHREATEGRVAISAIQADLAAIKAEQSRAANRADSLDRKLDQVLERLGHR